MEPTPRLVATAVVPASGDADGPVLLRWGDRRLITVRTDHALVAYDLDRLTAGDDRPAVTFPAPWPRRAGGVDAVAPDLDVAVFVGQHALYAVEPDGSRRWEIRHACWSGVCQEMHDSYEEYADDPRHRYPDRGSAWIGAGGGVVWAHVCGPLADDAPGFGGDGPGEDSPETWLVVELADGTVRARVATDTWAAGSHHIPHPDPTRMGLSVGEGQDGSPALWGTWLGAGLRVDRLDGDDRILVATGPSGHTFLTIHHGRRQDLAIHRMSDHAVIGTIFADALPVTDRSQHDRSARWDFECGVVDARTVVVSSSRHRSRDPGVRHWLIDVERLAVRGPLRYPLDVRSNPRGLGDGTWLTTGPERFDLRVWRLDPPGATE